MDSIINILNNSKFLAGVAILLTNIGGRYLIQDLSIYHQYLLIKLVVDT